MWGRRQPVVLVVLLLVGSALLVTGLIAIPRGAAYTPHDRIVITCDLCFTPSNGVTGGSGTPTDPYIIEGWDINASVANGITIRDTTAHFVIRNMHIHAGPAAMQNGMFLQRVANGRIEDVVIERTATGVYLSEARNITVARARVLRSSWAAIGSVGGDVSVFDSDLRDSGSGLSLNSWPVVVRGNDIVNNSYGIHYTGGTGVVIERNNITSSQIVGVEIMNAFGIVVADNRFEDNGRGLEIDYASQVTVSNNRLTNDSIAIRGDPLWHFNSHTISPDNLVNGLPVDYRKDCSGVTVDGAAIGELIVANCTNVQVRNQNFVGVDLGIELAYVDNATVISNTVATTLRTYEPVLLHRVGNLTFSNNILSTGSVWGNRIFDAAFMSNSFTSGGVALRDGRNYTIAGNMLTAGSIGVYVERSSAVLVAGNQFADRYGGVMVWSTTGLAVTANVFRNASGVSVAYVSDAVVALNTVLQGEFGISVWQSSNVTVRGNAIVGNNRTGIGVSAGTNITIRDNYVALNTDYGIDVGWSTGVRVAHNEFSGNDLPAGDDRGPENVWDDGYPSGGNYWSNYTGTDNCSGPAQNVCPDPDGIGDTPFVIDADTQDRYPLVTPPFGGNTPPVPSFTVAPTVGTVATSFTVNATGSSDAEDPTASLSVRWDWENNLVWDTPWSTTKVAQHSYAAVGIYTIRLQVRDSGGLTAETVRTVTIENTRPAASFTVSPASGDVATQFTVNASGSSDLEDASASLSVRWDWEDDGAWDTSWSTLKTAVHAYPAIGPYTVRVEVRDTGGLTDTATRTVEVAAADLSPPLIAHAPPVDQHIGQVISVAATVTDNRGVTEVVLHFRGVGDSGFRTVPMTSTGGDTYTADIPAQDVAGYVAYFITARDAAGHEARSPQFGEHTVRILPPPSPPPAPSGIAFVALGGVIAATFAVIAVVLLRRRRKARGPVP